jgi:hypothetical protein
MRITGPNMKEGGTGSWKTSPYNIHASIENQDREWGWSTKKEGKF